MVVQYFPKDIFGTNIHKKQRKMPYDKKIVGGGIPFYDGSVEFVKSLYESG